MSEHAALAPRLFGLAPRLFGLAPRLFALAPGSCQPVGRVVKVQRIAPSGARLLNVRAKGAFCEFCSRGRTVR